jgi:hypothetical protein
MKQSFMFDYTALPQQHKIEVIMKQSFMFDYTALPQQRKIRG